MLRSQSMGVIVAMAGWVLSPAMASSSAAPESPADSRIPGRDILHAESLTRDGQGTLSWLGLKVYDATLWTESGDFTARGFDQRIALRIDYHRSIPARRLVTTTRKEWGRLSRQPDVPDLARADDWLVQVAAIWPDVKPGDYILTVVEPGGASRFFGPEGLLGAIEDPAFGPAFLAIWLHPETSRPRLRTALIGDSTGGD